MNEMPEFYRERLVRARKPYTCCEGNCKRTERINPGDLYQCVTGKWNGEVSTIRSCVRCARLRKRVVDRYPPDYPAEGPGFGELLEYVTECRR